MKIGDLSRPLGMPEHMTEEDEHEFVLGSGQDLDVTRSFRKIDSDAHWQMANMRYLAGGNLIVSDFRGKDPSVRLWRIEPSPSILRGVTLVSLNEGRAFFRGTKAAAVEPLRLSAATSSVISHLSDGAPHDTAETAAALGKGWTDVSRTFAMLLGYGFISADGGRREYSLADETIGRMKPKERHLAAGERASYVITETWAGLLEQEARRKESGEKEMEVVP